MSLTKTIDNSRLLLTFEDGVDSKGQPVYSKATYTRVNEAATDESLQSTGVALASLCGKPLHAVIRVDQSSLRA